MQPRMQLKGMRGRMTQSFFDDCVFSIISTVGNSPVVSANVSFEVLPLAYVICDFATMCCYKGNVTAWWSPDKKKCDEDRKRLAASILPHIFSTRLTTEASRILFDQRTALYSQIMKKGKLRAEWAGGNADIIRSFSENPIFACTCAFGDLLVNPQCGYNYYKAPYSLHDAFELMEFIPVMKEVSASLMHLFKMVKACHIQKR